MNQTQSQQNTVITQIKVILIIYATITAFSHCIDYLQKRVDLLELTLATLSVIAMLLIVYAIFVMLVNRFTKNVQTTTKSAYFDSNSSPTFKTILKILRAGLGCFMIIQPIYFYFGLKIDGQTIGDVLSNCIVLIVGVYILVGTVKVK